MGLLSKIFNSSGTPKKSAKQKVVKNGDWEVHIREDETPHWFYKSGREWFSADETWASPNGRFFLHIGFDGSGNSGLALTTMDEGLKRKSAEYGVDAAIVLDDGTAYALSADDATLYIITPEKASKRSLGEERLESYILTPEVCAAVLEEDTEVVVVKAVDLVMGKAWKKIIKYTWPENGDNADIAIVASDSGISITTPDGGTHNFTVAGSPL